MRIIGHLDMDAFFAAIEERDHPELKGRPVVVGADPAGGKGRGVVATANYPARVYGIHSAMPISRAWQLAEAARRRGRPATAFVRGSHRKYGEVSGRIMAILHHFAPVVEEASIDEAYFDLSFTGSFDGRGGLLPGRLRRTIAGQGKAHRLHRPRSQQDGGQDRLGFSEARRPDDSHGGGGGSLPGASGGAENPGHRPQDRRDLARLGIKTVQDLKRFTPEELREKFGKWGPSLYERIRGRHDSPLVTEWEPKSVGEQETFAQDTRDLDFIFPTPLVPVPGSAPAPHGRRFSRASAP